MIEKPTLAKGDPPTLLMASICGALGTPGCWLVKVRLAGLTLKAGGESPFRSTSGFACRRVSTMVRVPVTAPT